MDAQVGARLKACLGLDDVSDIIAVLKSMPKSELPAYLEAFLGSPDAAAEVALLLGAEVPAAPSSSTAATAKPDPESKGERVHKKPSLDDDPYASVQKQGKKRGGATSAASGSSTASAAASGGATVTARSRAARVAKQAGRRRAWVQSIRCCGRGATLAHAMRVVTPAVQLLAAARLCASRRASGRASFVAANLTRSRAWAR